MVYEEIMESLEEYGVHMLNFHKIEKEDRNYLERYFEAEVAPVISPSIVGKRQPFPFLRNKEIYAVVVLETKKERKNWVSFRAAVQASSASSRFPEKQALTCCLKN